ncbi:MAG: phosphate acetyltransferase, partial [Paramuribaculum sp.]|nr:phosphate acetyltransferase [Paramuribaculum sp.]
MELIEKMSARAKAQPQRIVLPEGTEPRTLSAADRIIAEKLAEIILIGDPKDIYALAKELKLEHIPDATIINPADETVIDKYAPLFFELRKKKGISMEEARLTTANP